MLYEAADYAASLEAFDKAMALAPRWPDLHRCALNSWNALGDLATPRRRYEQAVADNPFDAVSRMALALLRGMEGCHDDAVREGREAVRLDPDSAGVRYVVCTVVAEAAIATLRVDGQAAWALFEEAIADHHALADMPNANRADALARLGEFSVIMARVSGIANPPRPDAAIGEREAWLLGIAVAAFAEAAQLRPDWGQDGLDNAVDLVNSATDPDVLRAYALGLADAGAVDLATTALERAVDDYPGDAEVRYRLGWLWTRSAQDSPDALVRAKACFAEAMRIDPNNARYPPALEYVTALIEARR